MNSASASSALGIAKTMRCDRKFVATPTLRVSNMSQLEQASLVLSRQDLIEPSLTDRDHLKRNTTLAGYPEWMMQLLGATQIAQGDLRIMGRCLPQRLDTVEQMIAMLDSASDHLGGSDFN